MTLTLETNKITLYILNPTIIKLETEKCIKPWKLLLPVQTILWGKK